MSKQDLLETVWSGSISLHISLAPDDCRTFDESLPYLIQFPRLSYLPFLLPRLQRFFAPSLIDPSVAAHQGWFSYQGVPLKWQLPVGLLYDLFAGADPANLHGTEGVGKNNSGSDNGNDDSNPWRLVLHFTDWPGDHLIRLDAEGRVHHDAFINSVKEADFLRNGTAKVVMSLSKEDSTNLWHSVQTHNLAMFSTINQKFISPQTGIPIRHVPIKVYLPASASGGSIEDGSSPEQPIGGSLKVVQTLVPPMLSTREPQTLGSALRDMLPSIFPSRRSYIHAQAVLHGAVLPLAAPVLELMQSASYADGFLHIAVLMVS